MNRGDAAPGGWLDCREIVGRGCMGAIVGEGQRACPQAAPVASSIGALGIRLATTATVIGVTMTKGPHSKRHHGPYQASAKTAQGTLQISDLGSWIRDGNAAATKTPTYFSGNTSPKAWIHQASVRPNSAQPLANSTCGPRRKRAYMTSAQRQTARGWRSDNFSNPKTRCFLGKTALSADSVSYSLG